ncbi:MAG: hypothetical protein ACR2QK_22450, partial [Acidimicrobiales bacterium]
MADKNEQAQPDTEAADQKTSIFDLFEPPPERGPNSFGKIPVIKEEEIDLTDASSAEVKAAADAEAAGLQHWTAPPTGQVPAVLTTEKDENGLWADVKGPSWHGDDPSWSGPDLADVFADTDSVNLDASIDEEYEDDDDDEYDDDDFDAVAVQRPVRSPQPVTQVIEDETQLVPPPPERRPTTRPRPERVVPPEAQPPQREPAPRPAPQARPAPAAAPIAPLR